MTQVLMTLTLGQGQRSRSKFSQNWLNTKQLATSLMLFHPQTSSYLLSQLFVTHLGVALLLFLGTIINLHYLTLPRCKWVPVLLEKFPATDLRSVLGMVRATCQPNVTEIRDWL